MSLINVLKRTVGCLAQGNLRAGNSIVAARRGTLASMKKKAAKEEKKQAEEEEDAEADEFEDLVEEEVEREDGDKKKALLKVAIAEPELHAAWLQAKRRQSIEGRRQREQERDRIARGIGRS